MPTYAELNTESYWRDERTSPELQWLIDNLSRDLGIAKNRFGSKGDNARGHMRGSHRSQRWILRSRFCTNRTYTVAPGLSTDMQDYLAGLDITPNSREQMLLICQRLDRWVRAGLIEEITEWYGNTNNDQRVDGWNNVENRVASSDSSHLWHLHITFSRWALRSMIVMLKVYNALTGHPVDSAPPAPSATVSGRKHSMVEYVWFKRENNDVTWAVERPYHPDRYFQWEVLTGEDADAQDAIARANGTVNDELSPAAFDRRAAKYGVATTAKKEGK